MKAKKIYRRRGAAPVVSMLSILEPAILGLDARIRITEFDEDYVKVLLPYETAAILQGKIKALIDTHVSI